MTARPLKDSSVRGSKENKGGGFLFLRAMCICLTPMSKSMIRLRVFESICLDANMTKIYAAISMQSNPPSTCSFGVIPQAVGYYLIAVLVKW